MPIRNGLTRKTGRPAPRKTRITGKASTTARRGQPRGRARGGLVAAFLLPGSPLPFVQRDNRPWGRLADAMDRAAASLDAAAPDTLVVYSTQWLAVLDQLWQTRPRLKGVHVDENWHEYGDLPFDIRIDTALAGACIEGTSAMGIKAKGVDYDHFPVDTGTIVAANFLNPGGSRPMVITANNVYHDWKTTEGLGRAAVEAATAMGRRVAVIGVGGLSGSIFRHVIDIAGDHIASAEEDDWNRRVLGLMREGKARLLLSLCPRYAQEAKVDMGFKHFAFLLGAMGGNFGGAVVHGYEPLYGSGGAVVEFRLR